MYRETKKNIEKRLAPTSSATMFDPRTVAALISRPGTSGEGARRSTPTKAESNAAEVISRRMVFVEPQPDESVHERVDEQGQAGRDRDRAGDVEVAAHVGGSALGHEPEGEEDRRESDGHVDPQHPLPAGEVGEHAAEQDADGAARAGHRSCLLYTSDAADE